MLCPKCEGKLVTKDTRHNHAAAETYRRKVCTACGHTIYTVEYETLKTESFTRQWNRCARDFINRHKNNQPLYQKEKENDT